MQDKLHRRRPWSRSSLDAGTAKKQREEHRSSQSESLDGVLCPNWVHCEPGEELCSCCVSGNGGIDNVRAASELFCWFDWVWSAGGG